MYTASNFAQYYNTITIAGGGGGGGDGNVLQLLLSAGLWHIAGGSAAKCFQRGWEGGGLDGSRDFPSYTVEKLQGIMPRFG